MQRDARRRAGLRRPFRIAHLTRVAWRALLLVACLPLVATAQGPSRLPRVILDAAGSPEAAPDVSGLPAAWRVTLPAALDAPDDALVEAFDARAPRGLVWLTVDLDGMRTEHVEPLVSRLRALVAARPAIRMVEPDVTAVDRRLGWFLVRRLAVELRAIREDAGVAVRTVGGAGDLPDLLEAGLAPLLEALVVTHPEEAGRVRSGLEAGGTVLPIAALGQALPPDDAVAALARAELGRLAGPLDIAGYSLAAADTHGAARVLGALQHVLSQDLTVVRSELRLALDDEDISARWPSRVLFGVDSLGTYVVVDVPQDAAGPRAATLTLTLPVAGAVALIDPVRGVARPMPFDRDETSQITRAMVTFPSPGRWLVDFHREADPAFVQREDVTGARSLTIAEILARHQTLQAANRLAVARYIADGTMQQYFRPTVTDPGFDVFTENRYYVDGDDVEWEELSFAVNGARWDENRPPFPLLQPEKVLSPPLVVELDQRYRYRLAGRDNVDGIDCYVVRFDPIDAAQTLYRGTVWIAADTFARVRQQVVQTNLSAPVVSNDETQWFAPVRLDDGRQVYMPSRSYTQQLILIAGRNLMVERHVVLGTYRMNPEDFEDRRRDARRSTRVMYRETEQGVRYFVKQGETRVVSDMATTRAKAQAFGVTLDPSFDFPLPIVGLNYLDFEFLGRKDTQLALLFGGVLAAGNVQRPRVIGRRVDLNVDFFAIAVPGADRFFVPDGEREEERVLTWPLSTGVNLGFQATSYQKASLQYQFRFDGYVRDRTTADDYTTPSSTVSNGLGLLYEYRRAGYALTASGVVSRRASWRPWGAADDLQETAASFERYAVNGTKTFYLGPFSKVVVNGAWFTGRRLDRFSRYQFGLFDETRVRGVPSAGVRYGELAMTRGQYSFNVFEQYRLDLFLDRAWGRTREAGVPWEGITGLGAAVNMRIPGRNLILRADVGKSFLPDRYGRLGSTVVQVLLLRPLP